MPEQQRGPDGHRIIRGVETLSPAAWERFEQIVGGIMVVNSDDSTEELEEAGLICLDETIGDYFVMTREGVEFAAVEGLH